MVESLNLIKRLYVNNGEYDFDNEEDSETYAKRLLSLIENEYSGEGYYHKYEELKEFIFTHHADSIAYSLYEGDYD